ncbi:hypothetical protein TRIP_B250416 [uncultured Desulfatiglans sp.]|uniref:Uncharacterized protein n=1 Tax=Uncultured Desulfatiglans sp. TaxID=1748965 RepID=A0A653A5W4_UNCDX|nr:hypothetical protein TRIP_B250416 [uncultured Desulfatiglans sp.]
MGGVGPFEIVQPDGGCVDRQPGFEGNIAKGHGALGERHQDERLLELLLDGLPEHPFVGGLVVVLAVDIAPLRDLDLHPREPAQARGRKRAERRVERAGCRLRVEGADGAERLGVLPDVLGEELALRRAHPAEADPVLSETRRLEEGLDRLHLARRVDITRLVMAFPDVSAGDEDAVEAAPEPLDDVDGVHPAGAHHADGPEGRRVLDPRDPGEVRPGIGAPVAEKRENFRFEGLWHGFSS